jgi:hypothetical protein
VRRVGDKVQVNVQVIDTATGAYLWADRFDTDRANLAEAQTQITGGLARTLDVELVRAEERRIEGSSDVEYETAIALNPNALGAIVQLGWTLFHLAEPDAAIAQGEKALAAETRRLAAILAADVAGYSRLRGGCGNWALRSMRYGHSCVWPAQKAMMRCVVLRVCE